MTAAGEAIVEEARQWLGTPFHHQADLRGVGCDCAGLVRGVGSACGVLTMSSARWAVYSHYGRVPKPDRMHRALSEFLLPVALEEVRIGDVLWLQWRQNLPMHLALLCQYHDGRLTLIHALSDFGRVVEHGLTAEWYSRIVSAWRYPGAADAEAGGLNGA